MTINQAIKKIVKEWEKLHEIQNPKGGYVRIPTGVVAVWCAESDQADSYEVDEEWIGVTPQGNIAWAYASGCSCWDGEYSVDHKPTLKELTLDHKHLPEDWEDAIIKFAEAMDGKTINLERYNRYE